MEAELDSWIFFAEMSAYGPKRTCRNTQSVPLLGVKRTWLVAVHMSACRAYWPKAEILDGRWVPPTVTRVDGSGTVGGR